MSAVASGVYAKSMYIWGVGLFPSFKDEIEITEAASDQGPLLFSPFLGSYTIPVDSRKYCTLLLKSRDERRPGELIHNMMRFLLLLLTQSFNEGFSSSAVCLLKPTNSIPTNKAYSIVSWKPRTDACSKGPWT